MQQRHSLKYLIEVGLDFGEIQNSLKEDLLLLTFDLAITYRKQPPAFAARTPDDQRSVRPMGGTWEKDLPEMVGVRNSLIAIFKIMSGS